MRSRLKNNQTFRFLFYLYKNFIDKFSYKRGKKNKIINNGIKISTKHHITGNNNFIFIENGALIKNAFIHINGDDNKIIVRNNAYVSGSELWIEDNNCTLEIGENTFIGPSHLAVTENDSQLTIGSDCMISSRVQIRTGDSHSILSLDRKRLNFAKNVVIGNHVWIGEDVKVFKGVVLKKDSVVSSGAIVTKSFDCNSLIGGVPAKLIKENITWSKTRI